MNLRIFVKIVACCACLYSCGIIHPSPSDSDFNFDSSFYPKRIGAQWKYEGGEYASSGLSSNPWDRTWWYEIERDWVWTLIKYEQINADSANILISAISTTKHTRADARYDSGPNGQPITISSLTRDTTVYRDTGSIGISRNLITLEFKRGFIKPVGAYWNDRSLSGGKYSYAPFEKRKGYLYNVPFSATRFSRQWFQQTEFIP